MAKKYRVTLTEDEQATLKKLVSTGKAAARKLTHARILLLADEHSAGGGQTDESIAKVLHVGHVTVARVRCRFVEEGFEAALQRRVQGREHQVTVVDSIQCFPPSRILAFRCLLMGSGSALITRYVCVGFMQPYNSRTGRRVRFQTPSHRDCTERRCR